MSYLLAAAQARLCVPCALSLQLCTDAIELQLLREMTLSQMVTVSPLPLLVTYEVLEYEQQKS